MTNNIISKKVSFFSNVLRQQLGDNVRQIILFGSRARGDDWEGSDYDFVVIVNHKDEQTQQIINDAEVAFLDRYFELATCIVYNEKEWDGCLHLPLGYNIKREGILL